MKLRERWPAVLLGAALLLTLFLIWQIAHAATASITLNWAAPTQAVDGTPLTGAQALTSYQIWVSTVSIPDAVAGTPTATVSGTTATVTQPVTASPGATIFARMKACNAGGCSVLSGEVSKVLPLTVPNPPTNITITLNVA